MSPRKLPVPKVRMSACIGFKRFDGIVLCADSAEMDGFVKRDAEKIRAFGMGDEWEVAVALAGGGALGDSFWGSLKEELVGDSFMDESSVKEKIERVLKVYVERYGATDETFRMLVAVHGQTINTSLFCQTEAMLSPVQSKCAIGLGPDLCEFLLTEMDDATASVYQAELLAVGVMSVMADYVDGVERPIRVAKYIDSAIQHVRGRESEFTGRFEFGDALKLEKHSRKAIDKYLGKAKAVLSKPSTSRTAKQGK